MKTSTILWTIVGLVIIGGLVWWFGQMSMIHQPASTTTTTTATTTATVSGDLTPDAYPLYSGVSWGAEATTTYNQFSGYQITSAIQPAVTDIASLVGPFEQYYATKLSAAGWTVDNSLAADGAGSSVTGYKKGVDEITVSYNSLFNMGSPSAPAQCPCEVTLQIFSGTRTTLVPAIEATSSATL